MYEINRLCSFESEFFNIVLIFIHAVAWIKSSSLFIAENSTVWTYPLLIHSPCSYGCNAPIGILLFPALPFHSIPQLPMSRMTRSYGNCTFHFKRAVKLFSKGAILHSVEMYTSSSCSTSFPTHGITPFQVCSSISLWF